MSDRRTLLQLSPAVGWIAEDRNGERCPVVSFALVEETDEDGTVRHSVEPLFAFGDVIELPTFPYKLRHESEFAS